eukprot:1159800-Pelagomonas_calceolata.AAC.5
MCQCLSATGACESVAYALCLKISQEQAYKATPWQEWAVCLVACKCSWTGIHIQPMAWKVQAGVAGRHPYSAHGVESN